MRDTGIGIPADHLDRLFKPFSQGDASTTRKYGGTGLGLIISKRLVTLMGGAIHVTSTVGAGSTFTISLPVHAPAEASPDPLSGPQPHLAGRRLLIVDDNPASRAILARQASVWGVQVETAPTGLDTLRILGEGFAPDAIILDHRMPMMDGIVTARAIRRLPLAIQPPLVLISAGQEQQIGADRALFVAILTPPIKRAQLQRVLSSLLVPTAPAGRARSLAPARPHQPPALRVLVADDNPVNQKVTRLMLEKLGYQPTVVADGAEVLEALARQPFDVVLMDVQMPVVDGVTATRRIRDQQGTLAQPWIIALTAHALEGDRERYLALGMDDYLSKPLRIEDLQLALARSRPRRTGAESAESTPAAAPAIDREFLAEIEMVLGNDGEETVRELIEVFLHGAPALMRQIARAADAGDYQQMRTVAHRLAGTSGQVGAREMAAACAALDACIRDGTCSDLAERTARLQGLYTRAARELIELGRLADTVVIEGEEP